MQYRPFPSRLAAALALAGLTVLTACGGGGGGTGTAATGAALAVPAASSASATAVPAGTDVAVHGATAGDQAGSQAARLADGSWVVVWSSSPAGDGLAEVRLQRLDAQLAPVGAQELVAPRGSQAQVVALAGGRYLVTWRVAPYMYTVASQGRVYDAQGARASDTLELGTGFNNFSGVPAALPDGGFVFVAEVNQGRYAETFTLVRRFAADGSPQGAGVELHGDLLAPASGADQNVGGRGRPALLADGRIAVLWTAAGGAANELRLSLFDAQAQALGTHRVLASGAALEGAALAALPGGGFAVAWESGTPAQSRSAFLEVFDAGGQPVARRTLAADPAAQAITPVLATLDDGTLLASWRTVQAGPATTQRTVAAQRFDAAGTALGATEPLPALDSPAGTSGGTHAVAAAGGSRYLAVYDRWTAASGTDVRATLR